MALGGTAKVLSVYEGARTFDEFARETMPHWDRLAGYLMRRYRLPAAVEQDDVRNELLLHAWKYIRKWDPARGMKIDAYVIYCSISRAKKWIHRQRKANGCRDESRHALTFTELGISGDSSAPAGQEAVVDRELELDRIVVGLDTLREKILVTAYWHLGDAVAAAEAVYAEPELRQACRFDSRKDARRAAAEAVEGMKVRRRRAVPARRREQDG